jgi:hypothetical protein
MHIFLFVTKEKHVYTVLGGGWVFNIELSSKPFFYNPKTNAISGTNGQRDLLCFSEI